MEANKAGHLSELTAPLMRDYNKTTIGHGSALMSLNVGSLPIAPCRAAVLLCVLMFAGCQSAMSGSSINGRESDQPTNQTYSNRASDWPLKFTAHQFGKACYSTYGCRVHYGRYYPGDDPDDVLQVSSDSVQGYPENVLDASWGPFPNFPPPAKVTWRSKDGTPHKAEVDIGEIFKDQLIRHNVPREDVSTEGSLPLPGIILEVNDRTINVYMRATIWTKEPQIPGNRLSNQRRDLIKVYSRTY
ncbi:MAG: hypothetical protein IAE66_06765 [Xanthomonadaceae bacterium]|nr:hypothetical protein [Xanthomonadaceae bacterium]